VQTEKKCSIIIAGDLAPIGQPGELLARGSIDMVFRNVLPVINGVDSCIVNLECPLTYMNKMLSKAGPKLKANPSVAKALKEAGVKIASLANNHIFDYKIDGVRDTIKTLEENSIRWYGLGENLKEASKPLLIDIRDYRIGFLSYAEHEFNWQSDDQWCTSMLEPVENILQIQNVAQECNALIIFLHIGPEGTHFPSPRMIKIARAFAKAGASAVVISHAHAIMGKEIYEEVPIVYGLGNFLFHSQTNKSLSWRLGQLVKLTFTENKNVNIELIPFIANSDTGCLNLLSREEITKYSIFYQEISYSLNHGDDISEKWKIFCASQTKHITKEILKGFFAMCPRVLLSKIFGGKKSPGDLSYYTRGANILRGLTICENHRDMLGQICDLLRKHSLREYNLKKESLIDIEKYFTNIKI